jgi:hypothetical protein
MMPASDDLSIWLEVDPYFCDVYGTLYGGMWDPLYAVMSRCGARGYTRWGGDLTPPVESSIETADGGLWMKVSTEEMDRIREETDRILAGTYDDQLDNETEEDGATEMNRYHDTAESMQTTLEHARHPRVSFRSVGGGNRRKPAFDLEAQLSGMEGVKRKSKPKKSKGAKPLPKPQPGKPFWMAPSKPTSSQTKPQPKPQPKPLSTMLEQARTARQQAQRKGKQAERLMEVPVATALERARKARLQAERHGAEAERIMTGVSVEPVHVPSVKLPQQVEIVPSRPITAPIPRRPRGTVPPHYRFLRDTPRVRAGGSSSTSPEETRETSREGSVLGSAAAWLKSLISF